MNLSRTMTGNLAGRDRATRRTGGSKPTSTHLWPGRLTAGSAQVGKPIEIRGRFGRVIAGTRFTITVEWD